MKKSVKIILGCLLLSMVLLLSCACGLFDDEEKVFETEVGFTVTLTDKFYEKSIMTQTCYFESIDSVVLVLKESFTNLNAVGLYPADETEYLEGVMSNNVISDTVKTDENGLKYFEYESTVENKTFSYRAYAIKGSDAYWLCQFGCESKNYEKFCEKFIGWAKTIEVA